MQVRILDEAEAVAAARWAATEPLHERRQRRQEALLAEVEALLARRWAATEAGGAGDIQTELAARGWWEPGPRPAQYRIFDGHGQPIICHLCRHDDRWVPEGDQERHVVRMFVCEHEPLRLGGGFVRQVATVSLSRVTRCQAIT